MRPGLFAVWLACALAHVEVPAPTSAQTPAAQPVLLEADAVRHDRVRGEIVAEGKVEIAQGGRVLLADRVVYDERADVVTATGRVSLLGPGGDVLFADTVRLTGDLKNGAVEKLRIRLDDGARIAAVGGRRIGGEATEMRNAVYSPCQPCEESPGRPLPWRVKARKAVHDRTRRQVEYTDAVLEMFGVPVLYTPFLGHPDPSVERRSGLLPPHFGNDSELGFLTHLPIYYSVSPTEDATFEPIVTTGEGVVLTGEYRNRFVGGLLQGTGSATRGTVEDGSRDFRGHVDAEIRYDVDDRWRTGADLSLASDDTYLKRYGFGAERTLTNHLFAEGFWKRSYAAANLYYFQGLRAGDEAGRIPIVHPELDYHVTGEPDAWGGRFRLDGNLRLLTRTEGTDSHRLSLKAGWRRPHTTRSGHAYTLFATLQADGYAVEDVRMPDPAVGSFSGLTGRALPQIGLDWRYPLARRDGTLTQLVEPVAGIVLAPEIDNPDRIPNEDSLDVEFDDTNVFDVNRFSGLDRVESGMRGYYGVKTAIAGAGDATRASVFLGQSYRAGDGGDVPADVGLEGRFSDFVGRVDASFGNVLDALYRFRIDNDGFNPRRHEVGVAAGPPKIRLRSTYTSVAPTGQAGDPGEREEILVGVASQPAEHWRVGGSMRYDFTDDGGVLGYGVHAAYEDECFSIVLRYSRSFTRDRDLEPTDRISVRLVLKTLGAINTGAVSTGGLVL